MDKGSHFKYLLDKYLNHDISDLEREEFYQLLLTNHYDKFVSNDLLKKLRADITIEKNDLTLEEYESIQREIISDYSKGNLYSFKRYKKQILYFSAIAASLLLFSFVWLYFSKVKISDKAFISQFTSDELVKVENATDSIKSIILKDESKVDLYPQSSIEYPTIFSVKERVVYLKGKAFFDVAKDTLSPFIVYSANLLTKVLGTSFLINSDIKNGIDEVEVHTGQVQIIENGTNTIRQSLGMQSLLLTPNQKGIYHLNNRQFQKTLISSPQPILTSQIDSKLDESTLSFVYEEESLITVFQDLETKYGVNIKYNKESLRNCLFTGSLDDSNLFNKLKIICLATQLEYKVDATEIIIIGKGCK